MSDKPISPLRQRMIDDMTARRYKEKAQKTMSGTSGLRGLPRPIAGHGDERGPSSLSGAFGPAADRRADHQRRHRRAAVLLQRDARTARPRSPSHDRAQAAQSAGRAEPGGGGASSRSRAGPEVQGRAQRRLRRGPAGVRGRRAEGLRHRQPAHDPAGRAGQGAAGPLRDAVAATARAAARMVAGGAAAGLAVSGPEPDQSDDRAPAQPRRARRGARRPASPSACRRIPCGTASPPICSNRASISASSRCCSATRSWRRRRSTPASPSTRSATSPARWSGSASTCRRQRRPR